MPGRSTNFLVCMCAWRFQNIYDFTHTPQLFYIEQLTVLKWYDMPPPIHFKWNRQQCSFVWGGGACILIIFSVFQFVGIFAPVSHTTVLKLSTISHPFLINFSGTDGSALFTISRPPPLDIFN